MNATAGLYDVLLICPLIIVFLAGLMPITVKAIIGREQAPLVSMLQAISGIFIATVWVAIGGDTSAFSGKLVIDGLSAASQPIILFITAGALFLSYENINTRGAQFSEYVFLIMGSAVGMMTLT